MSISLGEIVVILLVALLVIKPENLPDAAYTLGKWFKWMRQTTASIKREFEEPLARVEQKPPAELESLKPTNENSHD